jgi:predicted NUDIX family NTP pyrophosphohydrolase
LRRLRAGHSISGRRELCGLLNSGGPFWRNKDRNSWSIPKGEFGDDETAEAAAVREFEEGTGFRPAGALLPLGEAIQAGGKRVTAFAMAGDLDASRIESVSCEIRMATEEWTAHPRRRGGPRGMVYARRRAGQDHQGQSVFLDRLEQILRPMPSI